MSGQEKEWLTPDELAREVVKRGIQRFPNSGTAVMAFLRRRNQIGDPSVCMPNPNRSRGYLVNKSVLITFRQEPSDEWLTVQDIIAADLPGYCRDQSALSKHIRMLGWQELPGKSRKVQAAGSGYEYHVSLLTVEAQEAWRAYCRNRGSNSVIKTEPAKNATAMLAPPPAAPQPDLSMVKNSALLAELLSRMFRALGDEDGRPS